MYNSFALVQSTLSKPFAEYAKIQRSWKYWKAIMNDKNYKPQTVLLLKPYLTVYAEPSIGIAVVFDETYGALYMSYHNSSHRASLFQRFSRGETIAVSCIAGFIVNENKEAMI